MSVVAYCQMVSISQHNSFTLRTLLVKTTSVETNGFKTHILKNSFSPVRAILHVEFFSLKSDDSCEQS